MSFKPEVQTDDTGNWHGNALRFATKDEAIAYAHNLMMRQFSVRATRNDPSSQTLLVVA